MNRPCTLLLAAGALANLVPAATVMAQEAPPSAAEQEVEVLRETMANLLEALVRRGVLRDSEAAALVADARSAAQDRAVREAAREEAEQDAVRVTYVPEIVREQISQEVREQLRDEVVEDVVAVAERDRWGVPAALPEWLSRVSLYGDVRVRTEFTAFDSGNAANVYRNFQAINEAGGEGLAGIDAFLNTTVDRFRTRLRARVGLRADLTEALDVGVQLTTGNPNEPVSIQDDMEFADGRPGAAFDQAWMRWRTADDRWGNPRLTVQAGRFPIPFMKTWLIYDPDLRFEGLATSLRQSVAGEDRALFLTAGAFPIEEFDPFSGDKWLYGVQGGTDLRFGRARLRLAAAYYDFTNVAGERNALNSQLTDFTAPVFLQRGNTLFDIRNDTDPDTNLFALASDFRLQNYMMTFEYAGFERVVLRLAADYVDNVGFDQDDVLARTGVLVEPRTTGYEIDFSVGRAEIADRHDWRLYVTYKYLERDAAIDGFAESNFLLGGTDAQGYVFTADYGLGPATMLRARLLSANEIDGPPLGVDIFQLDVLARF